MSQQTIELADAVDNSDDVQMLTEMHQLLAVQRQHLKVREAHMDMMKDAIKDLEQKRDELDDLRLKVSHAIERNDINEVNDLHERVSILQSSQSRYEEMLQTSEEFAQFQQEELDDEYNEAEEEENNKNNKASISQSTASLTTFIEKNLSSLMQEILAIDPSTESSTEASDAVKEGRDAVLAQVLGMQKMLDSEFLGPATAEFDDLDRRQMQLDEFRRRLEVVEGSHGGVRRGSGDIGCCGKKELE
ncbi:hypothetical protein HK100_000927 [Physocladia obscura]|uniref:Uncharacterized protein n=1 Tax=Physocladia obscura TaxID=109957 RepID=A0AAD5XGJ4_9FUNG|nr:hypothetical protein HK100_000927 [Physocladia obscura]